MLFRSCIVLTLLSVELLRLFYLSDVDVVKGKGGVLSFYLALAVSGSSLPLILAAEIMGGAQLP